MRRASRPWPGWFVTFEGIDGSGKTTQMRLLGQELRKKRVKVLETREPGGTQISEMLRDIVLDPNNAKLTHRAELFIFLAARAQHWEEAVFPALKRGEVVLCDRFTDATVAYQHGGHGLPLEPLQRFSAFATENHGPDLTLLLDIDAQTADRRTKGRGEWLNRFDDAPMTFRTNVRNAYLAIAKKDTDRVRVIDATKSLGLVQQRIQQAVTKAGVG